MRSPEPPMSRASPWSRSPLVFASAPRRHNAGRPALHAEQLPQLGTKTITTWSPRLISITPEPTSVTVPAASWPRTIGRGRGRLPLTTERSEWHRLARSILTCTSPARGFGRSSSSSLRGLLSAYGYGAPARRSTALRIATAFIRFNGSAIQARKDLANGQGLEVFVRSVGGETSCIGVLLQDHEVSWRSTRIENSRRPDSPPPDGWLPPACRATRRLPLLLG